MALRWLRDDLTSYAKLAERNNPQANSFIQQRMAHWRGDPDLASLREPQALDCLSDSERVFWRALWHDGDVLAKRVAKQHKAGDDLTNPEAPKKSARKVRP